MIPREAYCTRCHRTTPTVLLSLRSALVGNCCSLCRTCRRGHPYASQRDQLAFNQSLMPRRANGGHHDRISQVNAV